MNILKHYLKQFSWIIQGGYNPQTFWENWGKEFINDSSQHAIFPQHAWILKKIKKDKPKTILEVGCGFGKNIKFLIDYGVKPNSITGVDISSSMLNHAKKYIKNNKIILKKANILELPFKNKSFDLVIVYAVLMHVSPKDIEQAIREVSRVAKKHIIIVEQNYLPKSKFAFEKKYTFLHDYKQLFINQNIKIKNSKNTKLLDGYYLEV